MPNELHGPRVLVVEDDATIRLSLVDLLELEGYAVQAAGNGRAALDCLESWTPDVILLDLMMPVMDGWAFRAAQRAFTDERSRVPVVVLSGAQDAPTHGAKLGAAATIRKPFDLDHVLATMARVVQRDRQ